MRYVGLLLLLLIISGSCIAQSDSLQARIVLIGDAGQLTNGRHPVTAAVKNHIKLDGKTTVIFLGDNLYTFGLPDDQALNYKEARAILDSQINIAKGTDAKVFFIPGNHDWGHESRIGWDAVRREQSYVDNVGDKNVQFFPKDGCAGPQEVNLTDQVVLIMIDSQWWLHKFEKPGVESDCPFKTEAEVLNQLEDLLAKNSKKLVLLAMHHPMKSYGIHGGYFPLMQHIFPLTDIKKNLYIPLPGIGSIYPIARGVFGTLQDVKHPAYVHMVTELQKVVNNHPNTIFAAGHEHSMQLIKDSSYYYIVSGAGSKETRVSKGKNSLFSSDTTGFATLEISKNKNVNVAFYSVKGDEIKEAYRSNLLNFSKQRPLRFEDTVPIVYVPYSGDSITVAANAKFAKASKVKRFFNGDNYRDVWATPVTLKVFDLKTMGFTIESLGGGKQTKSLRLKDKNGKEWVLRTIDKNIEKLLPEGFRGTVAQEYLQDYISTSHPYSPLIIPTLAKATNILVANPKIYFVPNDNAFESYRPLFANKLCLLEEREPTTTGEDTKSTAKVLNKFLEDNDERMDQQTALRARLLDFLVADWDRHFDQWRFAETDTGKGKLYYPIPRDRDQAFSYSDGLAVKLLSRNKMPFLKGFQKDLTTVKWLAYWGKDFDRLFINQLNKDQWQKTLNTFVQNLPDATIEKAVKSMPKEIYKLSGTALVNKLKARRDELAKEGMKYYNFLSKEVDVVGSNQREYFKVNNIGKELQVKMFKRTNKNDTASLMYSRVFDPSVTKEVRLYGLNDNDVFDVEPGTSSQIKLRIIGGKGNDTFDIKGQVKTYLYDVKDSGNYIANDSRTKKQLENNLEVNAYHSTGFKYNRYKFPNLNIGYNVEDGLLLGIGFTKTTYGFRSDPFKTSQRFTSLYAPKSGSYQARYHGEFMHVLDKTNLILNANLVHPVLNNFFGLGNLTTKASNVPIEFYRVRYNYAEAELFFSRRPNGLLQVGAGPYVYHYWNKPEDNINKILSSPSLIGLDSASVYQTKTYAGAKFFALLNNLNNELFPTRGVLWNVQLSALQGLSSGTRPLTSFTSDMTVYSSLSDPAKLVSVLRLGGGHIFSKQYEYFQALSLGQNNFLRGFRKNRFSGSSLAYASIELRAKLFSFQSYVTPGDLGLIGFSDLGRVWTKNEESKKWHHSYGGGVYYAAYNAVLFSATMGFSREEKLFNFTIGARFNLTF